MSKVPCTAHCSQWGFLPACQFFPSLADENTDAYTGTQVACTLQGLQEGDVINGSVRLPFHRRNLHLTVSAEVTSISGEDNATASVRTYCPGPSMYWPTTVRWNEATNLTFNGTELKGMEYGDEMKVVRGVNCSSGMSVPMQNGTGVPVEGDAPRHTISQYEIVFPEAGAFRVCYRPQGESGDIPLAPLLVVAGVREYAPTRVMMWSTFELQVEGVQLDGSHGGDEVKIVRDGDCQGTNVVIGQGVQSADLGPSDLSGLEQVSMTASVREAGHFTVCYRLRGSSVFVGLWPLLSVEAATSDLEVRLLSSNVNAIAGQSTGHVVEVYNHGPGYAAPPVDLRLRINGSLWSGLDERCMSTSHEEVVCSIGVMGPGEKVTMLFGMYVEASYDGEVGLGVHVGSGTDNKTDNNDVEWRVNAIAPELSLQVLNYSSSEPSHHMRFGFRVLNVGPVESVAYETDVVLVLPMEVDDIETVNVSSSSGMTCSVEWGTFNGSAVVACRVEVLIGQAEVSGWISLGLDEVLTWTNVSGVVTSISLRNAVVVEEVLVRLYTPGGNSFSPEWLPAYGPVTLWINGTELNTMPGGDSVKVVRGGVCNGGSVVDGGNETSDLGPSDGIGLAVAAFSTAFYDGGPLTVCYRAYGDEEYRALPGVLTVAGVQRYSPAIAWKHEAVRLRFEGVGLAVGSDGDGVKFVRDGNCDGQNIAPGSAASSELESGESGGGLVWVATHDAVFHESGNVTVCYRLRSRGAYYLPLWPLLYVSAVPSDLEVEVEALGSGAVISGQRYVQGIEILNRGGGWAEEDTFVRVRANGSMFAEYPPQCALVAEAEVQGTVDCVLGLIGPWGKQRLVFGLFVEPSYSGAVGLFAESWASNDNNTENNAASAWQSVVVAQLELRVFEYVMEPSYHMSFGFSVGNIGVLGSVAYDVEVVLVLPGSASGGGLNVSIGVGCETVPGVANESSIQVLCGVGDLTGGSNVVGSVTLPQERDHLWVNVSGYVQSISGGYAMDTALLRTFSPGPAMYSPTVVKWYELVTLTFNGTELHRIGDGDVLRIVRDGNCSSGTSVAMQNGTGDLVAGDVLGHTTSRYHGLFVEVGHFMVCYRPQRESGDIPLAPLLVVAGVREYAPTRVMMWSTFELQVEGVQLDGSHGGDEVKIVRDGDCQGTNVVIGQGVQSADLGPSDLSGLEQVSMTASVREAGHFTVCYRLRGSSVFVGLWPLLSVEAATSDLEVRLLSSSVNAIAGQSTGHVVEVYNHGPGYAAPPVDLRLRINGSLWSGLDERCMSTSHEEVVCSIGVMGPGEKVTMLFGMYVEASYDGEVGLGVHVGSGTDNKTDNNDVEWRMNAIAPELSLQVLNYSSSEPSHHMRFGFRVLNVGPVESVAYETDVVLVLPMEVDDIETVNVSSSSGMTCSVEWGTFNGSAVVACRVEVLIGQAEVSGWISLGLDEVLTWTNVSGVVTSISLRNAVVVEEVLVRLYTPGGNSFSPEWLPAYGPVTLWINGTELNTMPGGDSVKVVRGGVCNGGSVVDGGNETSDLGPSDGIGLAVAAFSTAFYDGGPLIVCYRAYGDEEYRALPGVLTVAGVQRYSPAIAWKHEAVRLRFEGVGLAVGSDGDGVKFVRDGNCDGQNVAPGSAASSELESGESGGGLVWVATHDAVFHESGNVTVCYRLRSRGAYYLPLWPLLYVSAVPSDLEVEVEALGSGAVISGQRYVQGIEILNRGGGWAEEDTFVRVRANGSMFAEYPPQCALVAEAEVQGTVDCVLGLIGPWGKQRLVFGLFVEPSYSGAVGLFAESWASNDNNTENNAASAWQSVVVAQLELRVFEYVMEPSYHMSFGFSVGNIGVLGSVAYDVEVVLVLPGSASGGGLNVSIGVGCETVPGVANESSIQVLCGVGDLTGGSNVVGSVTLPQERDHLWVNVSGYVQSISGGYAMDTALLRTFSPGPAMYSPTVVKWYELVTLTFNGTELHRIGDGDALRIVRDGNCSSGTSVAMQNGTGDLVAGDVLGHTTSRYHGLFVEVGHFMVCYRPQGESGDIPLAPLLVVAGVREYAPTRVMMWSTFELQVEGVQLDGSHGGDEVKIVRDGDCQGTNVVIGQGVQSADLGPSDLSGLEQVSMTASVREAGHFTVCYRLRGSSVFVGLWPLLSVEAATSDLEVRLLSSSVNAIAGQSTGHVVEVYNHGPGYAAPPVDLRLRINGSLWSGLDERCMSTSHEEVVCSIGVMGPGEKVTMLFGMYVEASYDGEVGLGVHVGSGTDNKTDNNDVEWRVNAIAPELSLQVLNYSSAEPSHHMRFGFRVLNVGPVESVAYETDVVLVLPMEVDDIETVNVSSSSGMTCSVEWGTFNGSAVVACRVEVLIGQAEVSGWISLGLDEVLTWTNVSGVVTSISLRNAVVVEEVLVRLYTPGGNSFSPEWLPAYGPVTLWINGTELNTMPGGDSVKVVRGGVCSGGSVVDGGNETSDLGPSDGIGLAVAAFSTAFYDGGPLTVCYRAYGDEEYRALPGVLTVAGVQRYSPAIAWKHEAVRLRFEGVGLAVGSDGDGVKFVRDGNCDGQNIAPGSAASSELESGESGGGLVWVATHDAVFHESGNVTVCYRLRSRGAYYLPLWPLLYVSAVPSDLEVEVEALGSGAVISGQRYVQGIEILNRGGGWAEEDTFVRVRANGSMFAEYPPQCALVAEAEVQGTVDCVLGLIGPWGKQRLVFGLFVEPSYSGAVGLFAESWASNDNNTENNAASAWQSVVVAQLELRVFEYVTEPSYHMSFGFSVGNIGVLGSVAYDVEVVLVLPGSASGGGLNVSIGVGCETVPGVANESSIQVLCGVGDLTGGSNVVGSVTLPQERDHLWVNVSGYVQSISGGYAMDTALLRTFSPGPAMYSPTVVKWYELVTLTFNGTELHRIGDGDALRIVRDGNCSSGTSVAMQNGTGDLVAGDVLGHTTSRYHGLFVEVGHFMVCYRPQGESGDIPLAPLLVVAGVREYAPTRVMMWSTFELQVEGVQLDGSHGGDEVKIVRDGDCQGTNVVIGQGVQSADLGPSDLSGLEQVSMTASVREAGHFTVCYRLRGSSVFVGLWPLLSVEAATSDLEVRLLSSNVNAIAGQSTGHVVEVYNHGPGYAAPPVDLRLRINGSLWSGLDERCMSTSHEEVVCSIGVMGPGEKVAMLFGMYVEASYDGEVGLGVHVGSGTDNKTDNNDVEWRVNAIAPELSLQVLNYSSAEPSHHMRFGFRVLNVGPVESVAYETDVVLVLPMEVDDIETVNVSSSSGMTCSVEWGTFNGSAVVACRVEVLIGQAEVSGWISLGLDEVLTWTNVSGVVTSISLRNAVVVEEVLVRLYTPGGNSFSPEWLPAYGPVTLWINGTELNTMPGGDSVKVVRGGVCNGGSVVDGGNETSDLGPSDGIGLAVAAFSTAFYDGGPLIVCYRAYGDEEYRALPGVLTVAGVQRYSPAIAWKHEAVRLRFEGVGLAVGSDGDGVKFVRDGNCDGQNIAPGSAASSELESGESGGGLVWVATHDAVFHESGNVTVCYRLRSRGAYYLPLWPLLYVSAVPSDLEVEVEALGSGAVISGQRYVQGIEILNRGGGWAEEDTFVRVRANGSMFAEYPPQCALVAEAEVQGTVDCVLGLIGPWGKQRLVFGLFVEPSYSGAVGLFAESWASNDNNTENNAASAWQSVVVAQLELRVFEYVMEPSYHMSFGFSVGNIGVLGSVAYDVEVVLVLPGSASGGGLNVSIGVGCETVPGVANESSIQVLCGVGDLTGGSNVVGSVTLPQERDHLWVNVSGYVQSISGGYAMDTALLRTFSPGPTMYSPTVVKWYELVTLTFNGTELHRIGDGDALRIVRDGNCSSGTSVAMQNGTGDLVAGDVLGHTTSRYHGLFVEVGHFMVCYRPQGESGDIPLAPLLVVAGVREYAPTRVMMWSTFELQVEGVQLDGSHGGDEVKIVRDGDCQGTNVVIGQGVQSADLGPSDLSGLEQVSMTASVREAGHFTVCYRLRGSSVFVGLWPLLSVEAATSDLEVRLLSSSVNAIAGQSTGHVVEVYNHGPGYAAPPVDLRLRINGSLWSGLDERCMSTSHEEVVCSIGVMGPGEKVTMLFGMYVEASYDGEVGLGVHVGSGTDNKTDNNDVEWRVNAIAPELSLQVLNYSSAEPSHHMRFGFRVLNVGPVESVAYETDVVLVLPMEVDDIETVNVSSSSGMTCSVEWGTFNGSAVVACRVEVLIGQAEVLGWISLGLDEVLTWTNVSGVVTSISLRNAVVVEEVLVRLYTPGGNSFSPEWLPAYGPVTLWINGTELNTLPGGDSVKVVRGGVCNGGSVVDGGNETSDLGPSDGIGLAVAAFSTAFYDGGPLTVCYRAYGDEEYRALPGVLTVAGVQRYSPAIAWKHEAVRLRFEGVGLAVGSDGDGVKFVRDGNCDGQNIAPGSAASSELESGESGGGLVWVATHDAVFHESGNVTVCYRLRSRGAYYLPLWPLLYVSAVPSDLEVEVEALGSGAVISGQRYVQGIEILNRGGGWAEEDTFVRVRANGSMFAEYPPQCALVAEAEVQGTVDCVLGLIGPWGKQRLVFGLFVEPSYSGAVGLFAESWASNDNNTENNAASAWQSVVVAQLELRVFEYVMEPSYHMSFGFSVGNIGVLGSVAYDVEVVLVLPGSASGGGLNVSIGVGCETVPGVANESSIQVLCGVGDLTGGSNVVGSVTLPQERDHLWVNVSGYVQSISGGYAMDTALLRTFSPGPTMYSPTVVKWYELVTLTFNGTELHRIGDGDALRIVRDGNCSSGTSVAMQNGTGDLVAGDVLGHTTSRYHGLFVEVGHFMVCYRPQGESVDIPLAPLLVVAGVREYAPTRVMMWSTFELQVEGVQLDGSHGGDEVKIVRDGDCQGTNVVIGQGVQSADLGPSDLSGLEQVSMTASVREAGHFTVCYRLRGSSVFVGLWPLLSVEAATSDLEVRLLSSNVNAIAGQSTGHVVEVYNHGPGYAAPPVDLRLRINGSLWSGLDERCMSTSHEEVVCSIGVMGPGEKVAMLFGMYVKASYDGEVGLGVHVGSGTDNKTDNNDVEWRVNAIAPELSLQVLNYSSAEPSHHMRFGFRVLNVGPVESVAYETDVVLVLPMEVDDIETVNVSSSLGMTCSVEWGTFNGSAVVACRVEVLIGQAEVSGWISLGLDEVLTWTNVSGVVTSISLRNAVVVEEVLVRLYTPGGNSFSPEWLPAYGPVTLWINGTELNTMPGGDSVKVVRGGVCNGGSVVDGGNETSDLGPSDGIGLAVAAFSTAFYDGGPLTVCYRAYGDEEYRALPGVLTVAGVQRYSPAIAWKHEAVRLRFEGVGLAVGSDGDGVKFVRDGNCDGQNIAPGSAASSELESGESGGGLVWVATHDAVFHESGNVTVCYRLRSRGAYYLPLWPLLYVSAVPSDLEVEVEALGSGAVISGQRYVQGIEILNRGGGWAEEDTFVRVRANGSMFAEYPPQCALVAEAEVQGTVDCVLGLIGPWGKQRLVFGLFVEPSYSGAVGLFAESWASNDNNTENNAASAWQSVVVAQLELRVFEYVMEPSYHMSFGFSVGNIGVLGSVAYDVEVVLVLPGSASGGGLNVSIGVGCETVPGVANESSIQVLCGVGDLTGGSNVVGSVTLPQERDHLWVNVSGYVQSISGGYAMDTALLRTFSPGPTMYSPTVVKWYELVTLTFNGTELHRIGDGDVLRIVRDGNCSSGTSVAMQNGTGDLVAGDVLGHTTSRYHGLFAEVGHFMVCYRPQRESGDIPLAPLLVVAGVREYAPTRVMTWSTFELQVEGVQLDGSHGGDEVKIVRDGDCQGTNVVIGQGVQSADLGPSDLSGLEQVSMTASVREAGHFTVCYRLRGSSVFVGLWPLLSVEAATSDLEVRLLSSNVNAIAGQSTGHVVEVYNHGPGYAAPPVDLRLRINGSLWSGLDERCMSTSHEEVVCSIGVMGPGEKVAMLFGMYVEASYDGEVGLGVHVGSGTDNKTDNNDVEWRVNAIAPELSLQVLNYSSAEPSHHMRFGFRVLNVGPVESVAYETDVVLVLPMEVDDIETVNVSSSSGMTCSVEWGTFNGSAVVACRVEVLIGQAEVSGWISLGLDEVLTWTNVSGVVTSISLRNAVVVEEVLVRLYTPGGNSFSPEWLPAYGPVTLWINGTELNTMPGGDSVKVVRGGVCNGGSVVDGGNETSDLGPSDGIGLAVAAFSTAFYDGGPLTVCYRAYGDEEYRALPGVLTVAGVQRYSPAIAWKHEAVRLRFEGVGLAVGSDGDGVKFVRDGNCDGQNVAPGSAASSELESGESGGGLVWVATHDAVFHESGNVTVCYRLRSRGAYYLPLWPLLYVSAVPSDLEVEVEALGSGAVISGQRYVQGIEILNRGGGWAEEDTFVRVRANGSMFAEYPPQCALVAEAEVQGTVDCVLGLIGPWGKQRLVFGLFVEPSYSGAVGLFAESWASNDNNTENNAASAWQSVVVAQLELRVFEYVMEPSYHMSFGFSVGNIGVLGSVAYDVEVVLVLPGSASGGGLNVSIGVGCETVPGVANESSIQVLCGVGDLMGGSNVVGSVTLPQERDHLWVNVSGYVQSISGGYAMDTALLRTFSPGPAMYSPTVVKWYELVTLTFNGTELHRIGDGDALRIVRDGNCSSGTSVAMQNGTGDLVAGDVLGHTTSRYHGLFVEVGHFMVCYRPQGESGDIPLAPLLVVAGVREYAPTRVMTWSTFELQVEGVQLDGSHGGDEVKIVRDGDCQGTNVVIGQGVQSADLGPSDLSGLEQVSMTASVREAGHFTVCYRLRGSSVFVGLWPLLSVEAATSDLEVRLLSSNVNAIAGQSTGHVVEVYNHGPGYAAPPVDLRLRINGSLWSGLDERCMSTSHEEVVCSIGVMGPGEKVAMLFGMYVEASYDGEVGLGVHVGSGTDNKTDNNDVEWRVNAIAPELSLQVLNYSSAEPSHHMRFGFRVLNVGPVESVAYETDVVLVLPMEVDDIETVNVSSSSGMTCSVEWGMFNGSAVVACRVEVLIGQAEVSGWISLGLDEVLTWTNVSGVVTSISLRNAVVVEEVLVRLYTPGGNSFSPEWLPAYGPVTLWINGTELNTLPGGDSVKVVRGGVCNGGSVVDGGNETSDLGPSDGIGLAVAAFSTAFYDGGPLIVCYRAYGDEEYRALPGVLTVAGVQRYSPAIAWKHEAVRLRFEGVGLAVGSDGDGVKFVRDGNCDGQNIAPGSAASSELESGESGGGLVWVATHDAVFHESGNVTVCFHHRSAGYFRALYPPFLIQLRPTNLALSLLASPAPLRTAVLHPFSVVVTNTGQSASSDDTTLLITINGTFISEVPLGCHPASPSFQVCLPSTSTPPRLRTVMLHRPCRPPALPKNAL